MIAGLGVDLTDVRRIEKAWKRHPQRFVDRLLHPAEVREFRQAKQPARFLAKRFAAKEAFVKALGTGFRGVDHRDIALVRGPLNRPLLEFTDRLGRKLERMKVGRALATLTDEGDLVCAVVVLENGTQKVP